MTLFALITLATTGVTLDKTALKKAYQNNYCCEAQYPSIVTERCYADIGGIALNRTQLYDMYTSAGCCQSETCTVEVDDCIGSLCQDILGDFVPKDPTQYCTYDYLVKPFHTSINSVTYPSELTITVDVYHDRIELSNELENTTTVQPYGPDTPVFSYDMSATNGLKGKIAIHKESLSSSFGAFINKPDLQYSSTEVFGTPDMSESCEPGKWFTIEFISVVYDVPSDFSFGGKTLAENLLPPFSGTAPGYEGNALYEAKILDSRSFSRVAELMYPSCSCEMKSLL